MSPHPVRRCEVFRVPTAHPADTSGVLALIASGAVRATDIRAIFGKTEGNGCVNDFTRPYALDRPPARPGSAPLGCSPADVAHRVAMVMSGGTEGGLSPHLLVFAANDAPPGAEPSHSLAIGTAFTRSLPTRRDRPDRPDRGHRQSRDSGNGASRHQPPRGRPLRPGQMPAADRRARPGCRRPRRRRRHRRYLQVDGYSRGASALGVALALGEVAREALNDSVVCGNLDLWSGRASTSAGIELMHNEVIVLGNSHTWASDAIIAHRVMHDAIDLPAVLGALADVGLHPVGQLDDAARETVLAVLAKADPSSTGRIRGARHVMLDDSDINATRHARALVGGVLAGVIGRTDLFVSGGAEHQGPDGGGPVAVIVRR